MKLACGGVFPSLCELFGGDGARTLQDDAAAKKQSLAAQYKIRIMTNYQMEWRATNCCATSGADPGEIGKVYRLWGIVGYGGPGSNGDVCADG